ncbi:tetratricopeptide repeat protein [Kitasatospora sp. NPDC059973]|uniref:tetratricopeptide repeat protein n=1 Tax=Kitasatospora sp. NPDC059973 TaxID=3347020 RepID=UPI0036CC4C07
MARKTATMDAGPGVSVEDVPGLDRLPAGPALLVGRRAELAALRAAAARPAEGRSRVLVLAGRPGSGRTTLAVRFARTVAADYPDGVLFARLSTPDGGRVPPARAARRLLEQLGADVAGVPLPGAVEDSRDEPACVALREALAGRKVLLLLDDVRDAGQLWPLLADEPGCLVLATTAGPLTGIEDIDPVILGGLDRQASGELLGDLVGGTRISCDPVGGADLAEACAARPAALRLMAGWLRGNPKLAVTDAAKELARAVREADATPAGGAKAAGGVHAAGKTASGGKEGARGGPGASGGPGRTKGGALHAGAGAGVGAGPKAGTGADGRAPGGAGAGAGPGDGKGVRRPAGPARGGAKRGERRGGTQPAEHVSAPAPEQVPAPERPGRPGGAGKPGTAGTAAGGAVGTAGRAGTAGTASTVGSKAEQVESAAAAAAAVPVTDPAAWVKPGPEPAEPVPVPDNDPLIGAFTLLYGTLSAAQARMLRALTLAPGQTADLRTASALVGCPAPEAATMLAALAERELLGAEPPAADGTPRYRVPGRLYPRLVRLRESEDRPAEVELARARLLERLVRLTESARALLDPAGGPGPDPLPGPLRLRSAADARQWLLGERDVLLGAVADAIGQGDLDGSAGRLVTALLRALPLTGAAAPADLYQLHEQVLTVAERHGKPRRAAAALLNLGDLQAAAGRWEQACAHYRAALEHARSADDEALCARALEGAAGCYRALGEAVRAADWYGRALALRQAMGDHAAEARLLARVAEAHTAQRRFEEAEREYRASLSVLRRLGDERGQQVVGDALAELRERLDGGW